MKIKKILMLKAVCPNCGAEITMSNDEYMKYRKATEGYSGSTIICQRKKDGKNHDIVYTNMDCPVCKKYIPMTIADCDDEFGFVYSAYVTPIYDCVSEEKNIDEYINEFFNCDEDEVENEEDSCSC